MDPVESDWYGPDMATFGDRLAAAREHAAMSQSDMAKRLGVKVSTLRKWEQDLSEPRANRLSMMAGLLNVSIMWLLIQLSFPFLKFSILLRTKSQEFLIICIQL